MARRLRREEVTTEALYERGVQRQTKRVTFRPLVGAELEGLLERRRATTRSGAESMSTGLSRDAISCAVRGHTPTFAHLPFWFFRLPCRPQGAIPVERWNLLKLRTLEATGNLEPQSASSRSASQIFRAPPASTSTSPVSLGLAHLPRSRSSSSARHRSLSTRAICSQRMPACHAKGRGSRASRSLTTLARKAEVDRSLEHVASAGRRVVKPAQKADWGGYSGYFADPDGFLREVAWNPHFHHL